LDWLALRIEGRRPGAGAPWLGVFWSSDAADAGWNRARSLELAGNAVPLANLAYAPESEDRLR